ELELGRLAEVHRADDGEVVGGGDDRSGDADDDQPPPAVLVGGRERIELADEAARERKAEEAEHERPHRDPEEGPLPAEAREVVERDGYADLALAGGDDAERAERH